jgi:cytoskeletal protein RodZ
MKKSLIEIYALVICFIMVLVFFVNVNIVFVNYVEYHNPTLAVSNYYDIEKYSSNDEYTRSWNKDKLAKYTGAEITAEREAARERVLNIEKLKAEKKILQSAIMLFVAAVFFVIHWILAAKWRAKKK